MIRLFAAQGGALLGVMPNVIPGDGATLFRPTAPIVATLDIDEDTNAALAAGLVQDPTRFTLVGSTVSRDGTPVAVAPAGPYLQDQQQAAQAANQIDTFLTNLDAGQTLTAAQMQTAIKILLRVARYVLKWIVKHS